MSPSRGRYSLVGALTGREFRVLRVRESIPVDGGATYVLLHSARGTDIKEAEAMTKKSKYAVPNIEDGKLQISTSSPGDRIGFLLTSRQVLVLTFGKIPQDTPIKGGLAIGSCVLYFTCRSRS